MAIQILDTKSDSEMAEKMAKLEIMDNRSLGDRNRKSPKGKNSSHKLRRRPFEEKNGSVAC